MSPLLKNLFNRQYAFKAFKIALFVGLILLLINHGNALLNGEMNTGRWGSALLSFIVPYVVNIQGRVTGNQHNNLV
jgi:hypothetical protein